MKNRQRSVLVYGDHNKSFKEINQPMFCLNNFAANLISWKRRDLTYKRFPSEQANKFWKLFNEILAVLFSRAFHSALHLVTWNSNETATNFTSWVMRFLRFCECRARVNRQRENFFIEFFEFCHKIFALIKFLWIIANIFRRWNEI